MKKSLITIITILIVLAIGTYFLIGDRMLANDIDGQNNEIVENNVKYKLTFISDWSEENHPENFPSNPHWSGLIGASHTKDITYWELGGISSGGIEEVAETGSKSKFIPEIEQEIENGNTNQIISGGGINPSPGEVSVEFEMTEEYPLVSVISMVAPSPDWIVGVNSLELFVDGKWIERQEIELFAYDAGTDSGSGYTSNNDDTNPKEPIKLLDYEVLEGKSIGRFVFERVGDVCIDRYELYETVEGAISASELLGCTNYHQHAEQLPRPSYMACENHDQAIDEKVAC